MENRNGKQKMKKGNSAGKKMEWRAKTGDGTRK